MNKKITVAMVSPHKVRCGISTYSEALSPALAKKGVDVDIIRLPRFGRKSDPIFEQVANKIPVEDIDLIHVQHEYGLYAGHDTTFYLRLKRLGKPIVSTMHAIGNWGIDRAIADLSDKIIVHNQYCKDRFRFDSEIIHHGCKPVEPLPKEDAMKIIDIDERIPLVGYCGFVSHYKGLETLIEAVAKVKTVALLIGGGWHTEQVTNYISQLSDMTKKMLPHRCKWLGFVPDEELAAAYGAMDIVVYPSIQATESGALLMAISHGKAVIANRLPPFRSKEKEGALITFKGVNSLAKKIRLLFKDDEYRKSLEEGAKAYAEANSWSKIAEQHKTLYEEVLSESAPR